MVLHITELYLLVLHSYLFHCTISYSIAALTPGFCQHVSEYIEGSIVNVSVQQQNIFQRDVKMSWSTSWASDCIVSAQFLDPYYVILMTINYDYICWLVITYHALRRAVLRRHLQIWLTSSTWTFYFDALKLSAYIDKQFKDYTGLYLAKGRGQCLARCFIYFIHWLMISWMFIHWMTLSNTITLIPSHHCYVIL